MGHLRIIGMTAEERADSFSGHVSAEAARDWAKNANVTIWAIIPEADSEAVGCDADVVINMERAWGGMGGWMEPGGWTAYQRWLKVYKDGLEGGQSCDPKPSAKRVPQVPPEAWATPIEGMDYMAAVRAMCGEAST